MYRNQVLCVIKVCVYETELCVCGQLHAHTHTHLTHELFRSARLRAWPALTVLACGWTRTGKTVC